MHDCRTFRRKSENNSLAMTIFVDLLCVLPLSALILLHFQQSLVYLLILLDTVCKLAYIYKRSEDWSGENDWSTRDDT